MTEAPDDTLLLSAKGIRTAARGKDRLWTRVLDGVDLELRRAEVLGIVGESGAGKSMLALALIGWIRRGCRLDDGSVVFDGIDVMRISERERRALRGLRMAYVAQSAAASFNPAYQLIRQFAEMPLDRTNRSRNEIYEDAKRLYGDLDLPTPEIIGFRYPHQLSGGQLQRAMIAMAMACRPDLIVFDEPTTALDVTTQIDVLASIKELVRRFRTAAVFISHDLAIVSQMSHRIMVMRHGRVVEVGETASLIANPKDPYTQSLWAVRSLRKGPTIMPKAGRTLLSLRNVDARYDNRGFGLKKLSFDVDTGQTVAIVGESGSGKSTTARVVMGLLAPQAGTLRFDGDALPARISRRTHDAKRRIQFIYQSAESAINPRQRISGVLGRPVRFYFGLSGAALERRIRELLEMVELPPKFAERYPSQLSGGQLQRVGIARALAAEPDIIICDEVTSGLDQLLAENIIALLMRRQQELGLSYILITHDLAIVEAIADHVVVMLDGRIVEQGPKGEVMSPPHHAYTARLLSSVPEMDPTWLNRMLAQRRGSNQTIER